MSILPPGATHISIIWWRKWGFGSSFSVLHDGNGTVVGWIDNGIGDTYLLPPQRVYNVADPPPHLVQEQVRLAQMVEGVWERLVRDHAHPEPGHGDWRFWIARVQCQRHGV